MEKFIIERFWKRRNAKRDNTIIRVNASTYHALCKAASESGSSIGGIANKAIKWAFEHLEYVDAVDPVDDESDDDTDMDD